MTTNNDILDRVKKIIINHLGVAEEKITEAASFIDDSFRSPFSTPK